MSDAKERKKYHNSLAKKLGNTDMSGIFTPEKIKECQEIFDEAQDKFIHEALAQLEDINKLCCDVNCDISLIENNIKSICQQSHQLRGRMESLGFQFCYEISNSLYNYTRSLRKYNSSSMMVVAKHVHALQAALRENHGNDGGIIGKQMVTVLTELIDKVKAAD
jgi:hypothetical protein